MSKARGRFIPRLLAGSALGLALSPSPISGESPARFARFYPGDPCQQSHVDQSFGQFLLNLGEESAVLEGRLRSDDMRQARLHQETGAEVRLLTNAVRAEWLLSYPFVDTGVGVWGRPILNADCSIAVDEVYVEAIYPRVLLQGSIDPRIDLLSQPNPGNLHVAARSYRSLFRGRSGANTREERRDEEIGAAARLDHEIFAPEAARSEVPWRLRLLGDDESMMPEDSIDILLSGSDGQVGFFGHIAVGAGGLVYNVYPRGSDAGAPGIVPMADYLFNAQRGQALRRPNWILRLEGLPRDEVENFREAVEKEIEDLVEGRTKYHPTANNCTLVSLRALEHLGFEIANARYFTRRFPRPAFHSILGKLPRLVSKKKILPRRIELIYVPQVTVRQSQGGAPNRPLRDRSRTH